MAKRGPRVLKRAAPAGPRERPSLEVAVREYVELARRHVAIDVEELDALFAARYGLAADDELLDQVDSELIDDPDSPVTMLAGDVTVHAPALMAGAVLTHRLQPEERAGDFLVVDTDLAGFARVPAPYLPYHDDPLELDHVDGRLVWVGPEHWLGDLPAEVMVSVRVDGHGTVDLAVLDAPPAVPPGLPERLREVYEREVAEPGLPVYAEHLLLGLRFDDRAAFTDPVPPLAVLAAAAGLEQRGAGFAHAEAVWARGARLDRHWRLTDRLDSADATAQAMEVLDLVETGGAAGLRRALDVLEEPDVVVAVTEELLGVDDDPARLAAFVDLADRLVAAAGRSPRAAVARWMAAVAAERDGRVLDAESHLRAGCAESDGWSFLADRLAWCEADRGDAAAALARWSAIGVSTGDADVAEVRRFGRATGPEPGRNEPCGCGSGRKFKQCHLGKPLAAPLPERVGWLWRKAIAFLERRGGGAERAVAEHVLVRASVDGDLDRALADPLTVDVVLHEGGWFARFLRERGPLLPADEALLGASWTAVDRTVYEVLDVRPGAGMDLRDLRTGDRLAVTERTASTAVTAGVLLCARAVPDGGDGHQFVGAVLPVRPGRERDLLALLDEVDALALLDWAAARAAPPRVLGPGGAELVECTARLEVPDDARAALDGTYEPAGEFEWVSLDDEDRVLASYALEGDVLTVRTLSAERMDDALHDLAIDLPDAEVRSDERLPIGPDRGPGPSPEPVRLDPAQLAEIQDSMERRWCDEHVPALDGHTPREAAADPTRRADLVRLIASFPEIDPATGAFGLRPWRLRELLGLG